MIWEKRTWDKECWNACESGKCKTWKEKKRNEHFEKEFEKLKVGKENLKLLKRKKLGVENHMKNKSSHEKK